MPDKPTTADGYQLHFVERVRRTCLYVATKLGDLMDDIVVVGGLVPSLLIDQRSLPGDQAHVGTMDLDIGLSIAVLEEERYRALTERLRRADFAPDVNEDGNPTRQRWRIDHGATVDFLIPPTLPSDRGGRLRSIERDFAALIAPGLHLAFQDRDRVTLEGQTIKGETASRQIWVCGPGAYVVLKALAFRLRGENKDAYDLFYVVRHYGTGVDDLVSRLQPLLGDPDAVKALEILRSDFLTHDAVGPRRVAEFLTKGIDDEIQADVAGLLNELCQRLTP